MTDTVLQSFCERCGTRYTFTELEEKPEGGRTKFGRLGRRAPEAKAEPGVSTALPSSEQFKGTFHFCLDCRQYTCASCWNADDGACISCRPPGETGEAEASVTAQKTGAAKSEPTAWPSGDLARAGEAPAHDHATAAKTASDSPWRQDGSDALAPGMKLDEWGRPRPKTQPQSSNDSDVSPKPSEDAPDPWRGVVFSTGEDGADAEARTVTPSVPANDPSETAAPAPMVWPESDQPQRPTAEPEEPVSAWPGRDRNDDQETASRLEAVTTPVDAGIWARASAAIVESGVVAEEASESVEPDAPAVDAPAADAPAAEAPAAIVEPDEAEVVDAAAASEAPEPVQTSADAEPTVEPPRPEIHFEEPPAGPEAEPDTPAAEAPAAIVEHEEVEVVDAAATSKATEPAETSADAVPAAEPVEAAIPPTAATPEAPPADASGGLEPSVSLPVPDIAADPTREPDPAPEPVAPVSPPAPPPRPAQPPAPVPPPDVPAPAAPPSPLAPITPVAPPDGIDVWATAAEPGPFGQPYQAPVAPQPPSPTPTVASAASAQPAPQPSPAPAPVVPAAPMPPPAAPPDPPAAPGMVSPPPVQAAAPAPAGPVRPPRARANTRACTNCNLPLSAKARFCRRCGSPQA